MCILLIHTNWEMDKVNMLMEMKISRSVLGDWRMCNVCLLISKNQPNTNENVERFSHASFFLNESCCEQSCHSSYENIWSFILPKNKYINVLICDSLAQSIAFSSCVINITYESIKMLSFPIWWKKEHSQTCTVSRSYHMHRSYLSVFPYVMSEEKYNVLSWSTPFEYVIEYRFIFFQFFFDLFDKNNHVQCPSILIPISV